MSRLTAYVVVRANTPEELEVDVERRLGAGWELCGGVAVGMWETGQVYIQAMTTGKRLMSSPSPAKCLNLWHTRMPTASRGDSFEAGFKEALREFIRRAEEGT